MNSSLGRINSSDPETEQGNLLHEKGHYLSFKRGREGIKIIDLIPMPELAQVRFIRWSEQSADSEFKTQRQIDVQDMKSLKKAMEFFADPEQKIFVLDYEPIPLQLVIAPKQWMFTLVLLNKMISNWSSSILTLTSGIVISTVKW